MSVMMAFQACLELKTSPFRDFLIRSRKFTIGRDRKSHFLTVTKVTSPVHAIIEFYGGQWTLTDKSSHGTWLNGKKLVKHRQYELEEGDILLIDPRYIFEFKIVASEAR